MMLYLFDKMKAGPKKIAYNGYTALCLIRDSVFPREVLKFLKLQVPEHMWVAVSNTRWGVKFFMLANYIVPKMITTCT